MRPDIKRIVDNLRAFSRLGGSFHYRGRFPHVCRLRAAQRSTCLLISGSQVRDLHRPPFKFGVFHGFDVSSFCCVSNALVNATGHLDARRLGIDLAPQHDAPEEQLESWFVLVHDGRADETCWHLLGARAIDARDRARDYLTLAKRDGNSSALLPIASSSAAPH